MSSDTTGSSYGLDAIIEGREAGDGNVPHGALLVELADAAHARDEAALVPLRARVVDEIGEEALVDACGVVANFERMVRIADGTGIPLDGAMLAQSQEIRAALGLDRLPGAVRSGVGGE